jgi:hypothetical protein
VTERDEVESTGTLFLVASVCFSELLVMNGYSSWWSLVMAVQFHPLLGKLSSEAVWAVVDALLEIVHVV